MQQPVIESEVSRKLSGGCSPQSRQVVNSCSTADSALGQGMEVTQTQPPLDSPRRTTSKAALGTYTTSVTSEKSIFIPSAPPLLARRASCQDSIIREEQIRPFKRAGSLVAISTIKTRGNSFSKVAAPDIEKKKSDRFPQPNDLGEHEEVQASSFSKIENKPNKNRIDEHKTDKCKHEGFPRPDRSLFLNFDNFKEALLGDSKVLSPSKAGEALFSVRKLTVSSHLEGNGSKKEKTRKKMQNIKNPQEHVSVKDEFTEFSQYGSRFMLNKVEDKNKKTNIVEQFPGNKILKKVAKTCQKHSQMRKSSATEQTVNNTLEKEIEQPKENSYIPVIEPEAPTALPRSKRDNLNLQNHSRLTKPTGEPDKFNFQHMERKSTMLFKNAEQPHSISMNTDPKPVHLSMSDVAKPSSSRGSIKLRGFSTKSDSDSGFDGDSMGEIKIKQVDIHAEYDLVQLIGEGWFSRVYLAEHRKTRDEVVLKAINSNLVTADEFCREYQSSVQLWPHKNILKVYDAVFQCDGYYMFAMEYAPLGDLTSNITEHGLGEMYTKRVTCQVGSALQWIHSKNMCHLDVKLDNILVFKTDFSLVKLCDFGSAKPYGDIVIKKNELLPYCPAELVAKHANEYYQVDKVQDVFQFGIVVFFCLLGILPWQKANRTDPHFAEFCCWREKRTSKVPRNFKPMTSRAQKLFRKLLDPDPSKRLELVELVKYMEEKWLRKGMGKAEGKDGQSQLTLGSFQSVHSNVCEKNCLLYTLLQHGVETTVDRSSKNNRIIKWIKQGAERSECSSLPEDNIEEEPADALQEEEDDIDDIEIDRITPE